MGQTLSSEEHTRARESFMMHVRKVVPYALFTAVGTGIYLIGHIFGPVGTQGPSLFQSLLLLKAFFGLWLGLRGFNQKVLKIQPWIFKGHTLPFYLVLSIILLSQFMYL